jgi:peptide/nickel transport system substrate-binding protein
VIRLSGSLLVIAMALAACNADDASPMPPRPMVTAASTTTTVPPPTTTTGAETLASTSSVCRSAFCLVYHIDPAASWSDGEPITASDFAHTAALHQDPNLADRDAAFDLVESVEVVDEKTIQLSFSQPYGAWQSLFSRVLREGETADGIPNLSTSGPFAFVEWTEGDHLTIARNQDWWSNVDPVTGQEVGDVSEITFVFIDTSQEMVDALEDGEVDVISARPDAATMQRLAEIEDTDFTIAAGPFWEHIDFHHDDPMLSQRWVRDAIALAIDREEILDRTVRAMDPGAVALDNTVFMANNVNYEPHFDLESDPARAEQLLVDNGCERGSDGIFVCGDTRMSFLWATTNDDPARAAAYESAREDLQAVGIEIRADFRSPSAFVTREFLFGGPDVWQLVNFSWRVRSDPRSANATYYCDDAGDLNVNRYCSEEVESLIRSTETIVDPSARAEAYNQADRMYLDDRAVIPLYQKPILMAWNSELSGPEPNYNRSTDLWNVASWSGKEAIVVALAAEPAEVNPISRADENANMILSALLYGAFEVSPSQEYLGVLVDSVEILEGQG